jgi:hypothetical protein
LVVDVGFGGLGTEVVDGWMGCRRLWLYAETCDHE